MNIFASSLHNPAGVVIFAKKKPTTLIKFIILHYKSKGHHKIAKGFTLYYFICNSDPLSYYRIILFSYC